MKTKNLFPLKFTLCLFIFFIFFTDLYANPWCEGFNSSTFPPSGWSINYSDSNFWTYNTVSAFCFGTGSAKFDFWTAWPGIHQSLNTFTFTSTTGQDTLSFSHAYAPYSRFNQDSLNIFISTDGGITYNFLIGYWAWGSQFPGSLATAPPTYNLFVPTCTQWARKFVTLPLGTNKIKFLAVSGNGNNLYIDTICVGHVPIGIEPLTNKSPENFALYQNYPNPFNPTTKIKFDIPNLSPFIERGVGGFITLKIYDILGREVATLVNEKLIPGKYEVEWDASNFSSEVYLYTLTVGNYFSQTKRMLLIK